MPPNAEERSEAALRGYYAGEPFTEFDHWNRRGLTDLAYLMLPARLAGRRQAAEEVAQDALCRVAATLSRPNTRWDPTRAPLRRWLITILKRCVLNRLRGKHPREMTEIDCPSPNGDPDGAPLEANAQAEGPGPPELAAFNERLEALEACIEALPGRLRLAVQLKFFERLLQTEIAQRLGVSAPTVSRLFENCIYPQLRACLAAKGLLPDEM
jgi:RNA polymerase sigma factor (sigma-70 family)